MAKQNVRIINGKQVDISTRDGAYQWIQARAANPDRYKDDDDSKLGNTMLSDPRKQTISVSAAATRLTAAINLNKITAAEVKVDDLSGTLDSPGDKVHGDSEFGETDEENEGKKESGEKKEDEVKETVEIAKDEIEKLGELVVNIDDILSNINQQVEEITNPEVEENLDMAEQAQNGEMPEEPKVEAKRKVKAADEPQGISYADVKEITEDELQEAFRVVDIASEANLNEVSSKSYDGFIPFTDGGAEVDGLMSYSDALGSRNADLSAMADKIQEYPKELMRDYVQEHKEAQQTLKKHLKVEDLDEVDDDALYSAIMDTDIIDDLEEYAHSDGNGYILAKMGVYFYEKGNTHGDNPETTSATVYGEYNDEAPYYRPKYGKYIEESFSFNTVEEYEAGLKAALEKIKGWMTGKGGKVEGKKTMRAIAGKKTGRIEARKFPSRKVKADAEPTATEPLTEEHTSAILDYIADNPEVSDADFHEFVEGLGVDIHEAETLIYRTLSEMMKDEKQEEAEGQDESHLEAEASKKKDNSTKVQIKGMQLKANKSIEVKTNLGDTGHDTDYIIAELNKVFEKIKEKNPEKFMDSFEEQFDNIAMNIAEEVGAHLKIDGETYIYDFTRKTARSERWAKVQAELKQIKATKVKAEITEADETATSKEKAIANFEHQVKLYRKGDETMGVVDMYERAARKMGATDAEISAIWKKHEKIEAAAIEDIEHGGVEKLLVENYKHEIELLKEGIAYSEEQKANAEAWAIKEYDAIIDGNKKRIEEIEQTLKNIAAMNGKKESVKVEADTIKDYQPGQKVKVNLNGKDVDGTVEKSNPTDNTVEVKPVIPGAPAPVAPAPTDPAQPKPAGTETIKVQLPKEQNNPIKKAMLNRVKARKVKAMDDMGNPYIPEKDARIYVYHILDRIKTANKVTWQIGNSGTQVRGEEKYGAPYFYIDVDDISMLQITIDPKKQEAELSVEDPSRDGRRINLVIEIADIETADYSKIGQAIDGNLLKHLEANE